jgi:hypothetical protein
MTKSLIVLKESGESVHAEILEDSFTLKSILGEMIYPREHIARITFDQFEGEAPDQLVLHNKTVFHGNVLDTTVRVKLSSGDDQTAIATAKIRTIQFG